MEALSTRLECPTLSLTLSCTEKIVQTWTYLWVLLDWNVTSCTYLRVLLDCNAQPGQTRPPPHILTCSCVPQNDQSWTILWVPVVQSHQTYLWVALEALPSLELLVGVAGKGGEPTLGGDGVGKQLKGPQHSSYKKGEAHTAHTVFIFVFMIVIFGEELEGYFEDFSYLLVF